jgi:hypothetical protein
MKISTNEFSQYRGGQRRGRIADLPLFRRMVRYHLNSHIRYLDLRRAISLVVFRRLLRFEITSNRGAATCRGVPFHPCCRGVDHHLSLHLCWICVVMPHSWESEMSTPGPTISISHKMQWDSDPLRARQWLPQERLGPYDVRRTPHPRQPWRLIRRREAQSRAEYQSPQVKNILKGRSNSHLSLPSCREAPAPQ